MFYNHHVIDDALESKVGKQGLHRAALDRELANASKALDKFRQWKADGTLPTAQPARRATTSRC